MIALRRPLLLLTLAALVGATIAATPAEAAKRKVPFGFFGTVLQPDIASVPDAAIDQQMALMARSGVESVRTTMSWERIEPTQGVYDWARTDALVRSAANHRLELLAFLVLRGEASELGELCHSRNPRPVQDQCPGMPARADLVRVVVVRLAAARSVSRPTAPACAKGAVSSSSGLIPAGISGEPP